MNGNSPEAQGYGQALEDASCRAIGRLEKLPTREAINAAIDLAMAGGVDLADIFQLITCGEYAGESTAESVRQAFELGCLERGH